MPQKHQHFKLTDKNVHHIFQSPKKLALFVAVFVTVILCAVIVAIYTNPNKGLDNLIGPQQKIIALKNDYEKEFKEVLNTFLKERERENFVKEDFCRATVTQTINKILDLTVPLEYKELQLSAVILLDKESQDCPAGKNQLKEELAEEWEKIKESYSWLKN